MEERNPLVRHEFELGDLHRRVERLERKSGNGLWDNFCILNLSSLYAIIAYTALKYMEQGGLSALQLAVSVCGIVSTLAGAITCVLIKD